MEKEVDLPCVIIKDKIIQVHSPLFINLELKNTYKLSVLVNLVNLLIDMKLFIIFILLSVNIHMPHCTNKNMFDYRALPWTPLRTYMICSVCPILLF